MVLWLKYEPQELVDTSNLSSEEWLSYRRRGIGGSDAAAILGISPWRTARDLYYDKLNVVKADMDENWVALEMGHLLEDLVARIFAKKTGLHIFQRKVMFQHPLYPWMLADLDYLVELPDGSNAILEIKTTNYNARENWWYNGEEIVPVYYESQGRHYMSVMNLDRVYFCCLYGNNEDEVIIRHLDRDYAYESELIALEDAFWNDHVQKHQPPDYTESGDLILQSLQRWKGIDRRDLPPTAFGAPQLPQGAARSFQGGHRVGHPRALHQQRGVRPRRGQRGAPAGRGHAAGPRAGALRPCAAGYVHRAGARDAARAGGNFPLCGRAPAAEPDVITANAG